LAQYLRERGVGPEVCVAIMMDRSITMLCSVLAIVKAGGAYLPLDPANPAESLNLMIEDTGARILLAQQKYRDKLPSFAGQLIDPQAEAIAISMCSDENAPRETVAANLAYVMYTSGSTGQPKGVEITHRSILRLVKSNYYAHLSAGETILQ